MRALGSRHPTRCTNFCGTDSLPRPSWPCCSDMAPQTLNRRSSGRGVSSAMPLVPVELSTAGRPRPPVRLPALESILPLPTPLSPGYFRANAQPLAEVAGELEGVVAGRVLVHLKAGSAVGQ
jgi:hypothetical protein